MTAKMIRYLLFGLLILSISGFSFKDAIKKLDKSEDEYEVKNSPKATGVRGLGEEGKLESENNDVFNAEIPYVEISTEELEEFKKQGGLK